MSVKSLKSFELPLIFVETKMQPVFPVSGSHCLKKLIANSFCCTVY